MVSIKDYHKSIVISYQILVFPYPQKLSVIALLLGICLTARSRADPDSLNFEKFAAVEQEFSFGQV